jgi:hypothetical protein
MAEVYDYVPGVPGSPIARTLPNGDIKTSQANKLERVIALTEEAQRAILKEGMKVFQRADFRMKAAQQRHLMELRERAAEAVKEGDPKWIEITQRELADYLHNRTKVTWSQADVDFHVSLFREDGREFHVEVENDGGRGGLSILRDSLKR